MPTTTTAEFYALNIYTGNRILKDVATDPLYGKRSLAFIASLQPEAPRSPWRVAPQNHLELLLLLTHHAVRMRRRDFLDVNRRPRQRVSDLKTPYRAEQPASCRSSSFRNASVPSSKPALEGRSGTAIGGRISPPRSPWHVVRLAGPHVLLHARTDKHPVCQPRRRRSTRARRDIQRKHKRRLASGVVREKNSQCSKQCRQEFLLFEAVHRPTLFYIVCHTRARKHPLTYLLILINLTL